MTPQELFNSINEHFDEIAQKTARGNHLIRQCLTFHPADIAEFLQNSPLEHFDAIFAQFPPDFQQKIFEYLSNSLRARALRMVEDKQRLIFLENMGMDDISDLVDFASTHELKQYFSLLHQKDREKVVDLLKLKPSSVGTVMDLNVVSLHQHATVERSIQILRHLEPEQELHRTIYLTDSHNHLVGQIWLEDLVLKAPHMMLSSFMRPVELVVKADEDQEDVAKKMRHYQLTSAPVVSKQHLFLGAVTDKTLVDIVEEEAGEDILRISAVTGIKHTYFETPFFRHFFNRGSILFTLMLIESITSHIMHHYEALLVGTLGFFITTLVSTGGNSSTQTSAVVVQGLASGELNVSNIKRFLRRETLMSLCLAFLLGIGAFCRVYYLSGKPLVPSIAVGTSIGTVVFAAVILGCAVPFILKRVGLDPAYAAAPFLATGIDILGLWLYCMVSQTIFAIF
jgi:magnesium transporter